MRVHLPRAVAARGAALVEGVMAVVISSLLFSVLPGFYFGYINVWQRETGRLGAVQRADSTLRRMREEIRNARSLTLSSDGTTLTLTHPRRSYDGELGRLVNDIDENGNLIDGNRIQYYFVQDPDGTGSSGGVLYRRVLYPDGSQQPPRLVADCVYPQFNPLAPSGTAATLLFSYDSGLRMVTVTVTAAEPEPSAGSFAAVQADPKCRRCGGQLVRVATSEHPEGEIQCSQCADKLRASARIATYRAQFGLRNQ